METLKRYWTKRVAFVIMLLLVGASLAVSSLGPAYASPCCEWKIITNYYSDASHTVLVGRCIDSDCDGYSCTGEQTEFTSQIVLCCAHCGW